MFQKTGVHREYLVPTNGSLASKRAAEVAFGIAFHEQDEVHILNVVESKESFTLLDVEGSLKGTKINLCLQNS